MIRKELKTSEYHPFYSGYLGLVSDDIELIKGYEDDTKVVLEFFQSIPKEKLNYRYLDGKWSIKEVFQHIIDTERVFQFRCFHIARHDKTPIPGFEQDDYIKPSNADNKSIEALMEEFKSVRESFTILLKSLSYDDLMQVGNANGADMSARAAAFIILGHSRSHLKVVKERYL